MKYFLLRSGQTRYPASYVKSSGKPYRNLYYKYNNFDKLDQRGLLTWEECKLHSVTLPTPDEEPVGFIYIHGWGTSYYMGIYDRKEEYERVIAEQNEKRRRQEILRETLYRERVVKGTEKKLRYKVNFTDLYSIWKGSVEVVEIRLTGSKNEIEEYLHSMQKGGSYLSQKYEIIKKGDYYKNRKDENFRLYVQATRKKEVFRHITRVAGVSYEGRQELIRQVTKDHELKLIREPNNPHDSNAVAIYTTLNAVDKKIGYVHAAFADDIAPLLDSGQTVLIKNLGTEIENYCNQDYESGYVWNEWSMLGLKIELIYEDFSIK